MIGKIYQAPDLSPLSAIERAEAVNEKPQFPWQTIMIENSTAELFSKARKISSYYARLASPTLHDLAAIRQH